MTTTTTLRQVAAALDLTKRAAEKRATREAWPCKEERVRGGRQRLYQVGDLPIDVQTALARKHLDKSPSPASSRPLHAADALSSDFDAKPERIKAIAGERLDIVRAFHELVRGGFSRKRAFAAIVSRGDVSLSSLHRYVRLVRGKPEHLWLALLAPQYDGRDERADMSAEAWEQLKADYLRIERPAAMACITRLIEAAKKRPDWTLPSVRTMRRRLQEIPRGVQLLARQGPKALQQTYPAQQRSRLALHALEIINGDGYKHNVWVRFPDGDVVRAKTWFWQDVYSGKILAWRTDKSEHTEMIRLAFGDVVERFGIPEAVVIDNTMAAANKAMSGGIRTRYRFKIVDEEPDGVFKTLAVDVTWATPGHGQAKPVERAFGVGGLGEYIDKAPEFAGGWTGANPLDKPEYDGKTKAVDLEQLAAVIAREILAWNARPGRRSHVAQGRSFDEVFQESYEKAEIRKATIAQHRLWLLKSEPVKAHAKDGSIALQSGRITRSAIAPTLANRYWAAPMIEYAGKLLVARFDPQQLHVGLHVYTTDGRYVCFADCHAPQGFNDTNAAREHARDRRSFLRAQREQLDLERRMSARELVKHRAGSSAAPPAPSIPAAKVVRPQFGHALERPLPALPEMTDRDREELERMAAELNKPRQVRVHQLRDDHEKHAYWVQLNARRAAGEQLAEDDERFWQHFQEDPYFRLKRELDEDFERRLAARSA